MRTIVIVTCIIFLIISLGFILISKMNQTSSDTAKEKTFEQQPLATQEPPIVREASFKIVTNGTTRVFTAPMYHNLSKDVFIEAKNPNMIHIRKSGITWNNFFSTLPFTLTHNCLTTGTKETFCTGNGSVLKFYLNGERNTDVLDREINNMDELLISFGKESEEIIQQQIN